MGPFRHLLVLPQPPPFECHENIAESVQLLHFLHGVNRERHRDLAQETRTEGRISSQASCHQATIRGRASTKAAWDGRRSRFWC